MKKAKRYNQISTLLLCILFFMIAPIQLPKLWGWQMFAILTGSMEPAIPTGSMIYVKPVHIEEIKENDIITFRLGSGKTNTATHRVVGIQQDGVITKGDANPTADAMIVDAQRLIGKVVYSLPICGYFLMFIGNPIGMISFVFLLSLCAFCAWKAHQLKRGEKEKK